MCVQDCMEAGGETTVIMCADTHSVCGHQSAYLSVQQRWREHNNPAVIPCWGQVCFFADAAVSSVVWHWIHTAGGGYYMCQALECFMVHNILVNILVRRKPESPAV